MRIILVDDNPFDRELVTRMLQRTFSEANLWSCGSLEEFRAALNKGEPDVVVTDFRLQDTDGLQILAETKERFPHCPVVMFTDSGNEELVVKAMRAGLSDYILKRHLRTLPQVVMRCLEEAQVRKERDQAVTELEESERRFRAIANLVSDYAFGFLFDEQNLPRVTWISPSFSRRLGYTLEDFRERNLPLLAIAHPDDSPLLQQAMERVREGESATFIHRVLTKTQEVRWVRHFCSPRFEKDSHHVIGGDGAAQDITEQKVAEDALRARMAQLALLNQVAQAVLERHDLASMFHTVLSQIEQHLPVDVAWIAQLEGE
uniref:Response regulator n=1 Tax=Thermoanaerobaculum aquaticum TaxID=1312852 RepID=A0A7C2S7W3_9BACT